MRQELAAHALAEVARLERLERCSLTPKDETSIEGLLCGKLHEELEEVTRMVETLAPPSDCYSPGTALNCYIFSSQRTPMQLHRAPEGGGPHQTRRLSRSTGTRLSRKPPCRVFPLAASADRT